MMETPKYYTTLYNYTDKVNQLKLINEENVKIFVFLIKIQWSFAKLTLYIRGPGVCVTTPAPTACSTPQPTTTTGTPCLVVSTQQGDNTETVT